MWITKPYHKAYDIRDHYPEFRPSGSTFIPLHMESSGFIPKERLGLIPADLIPLHMKSSGFMSKEELGFIPAEELFIPVESLPITPPNY